MENKLEELQHDIKETAHLRQEIAELRNMVEYDEIVIYGVQKHHQYKFLRADDLLAIKANRERELRSLEVKIDDTIVDLAARKEYNKNK